MYSRTLAVNVLALSGFLQERSSTEARKVDVMQDFHSGKKSFNISSDRTPSPAVCVIHVYQKIQHT